MRCSPGSDERPTRAVGLSGGRVTADVGDDGVGRLDSADRLLRESAAEDVVKPSRTPALRPMPNTGAGVLAQLRGARAVGHDELLTDLSTRLTAPTH